MATCTVNDLLASGPCFMALQPYMLQATALAQWCDIAANITPSGDGAVWWNPDVGSGWVNPDVGSEPIVNPII
jgi:hypothetical protein